MLDTIARTGTDSIVVDLATNAVGILFINHPHEPDVSGPPSTTVMTDSSEENPRRPDGIRP